MFATLYPSLAALNIIGLPRRVGILSAILFNALIIVALIPLALPRSALTAHLHGQTLQRAPVIYGMGGWSPPFVGIFLIDLLVRLIPGI